MRSVELGAVVPTSWMNKKKAFLLFVYFRRKYHNSTLLTPHSSLLTPHSSLHTPHSHETLTDFRMALMAPFSSRETWAWEIPRASATSIWVFPS